MKPRKEARVIVDTKKAVIALQNNELVGLPTETVYGLGARISSPEAIEKIFHVKQRPFFDPLIVHVSSIKQAQSYTSDWPEAAQKLAEDFWPGPLTLVVKKNTRISDMITAGRDYVGIRMPRHPLFQKLLSDLHEGIAAPSANRFGKLSPTSVEDVLSEFPNEDFLIVDGGKCEVGIESTVIKIEQRIAQILRPGMIHIEEIEQCLTRHGLISQYDLSFKESELSPGHLDNHYQPDIPVVYFHWKARDPWKPESVSSELQKRELPSFETAEQLQLPEAPALAARVVYSELRRLAQSGASAIYFIEPQEFRSDQWLAIRNRLLKAASYSINLESGTYND